MTTPFTDTINTHGWVQYFDAEGQEWRRESKGAGIYAFYRKQGDCFIKEGHCHTHRKGIQRIHDDRSEVVYSMEGMMRG